MATSRGPVSWILAAKQWEAWLQAAVVQQLDSLCIGVHDQAVQAVNASRLRLDLPETMNVPQRNIAHVTEAVSQ